MPPVATAIPDGAAIRRIRLRLGLSCRDVKNRIGGRHERTISRLEYSSDPASIVLLAQVARALEVEAADIIIGGLPDALREPVKTDGNGQCAS